MGEKSGVSLGPMHWENASGGQPVFVGFRPGWAGFLVDPQGPGGRLKNLFLFNPPIPGCPAESKKGSKQRFPVRKPAGLSLAVFNPRDIFFPPRDNLGPEFPSNASPQNQLEAIDESKRGPKSFDRWGPKKFFRMRWKAPFWEGGLLNLRKIRKAGGKP